MKNKTKDGGGRASEKLSERRKKSINPRYGESE
jgi:hypothetical protein